MTTIDRLAALKHFKPGDSTRAHYDAWASDYERDLLDRCGYSAHVIGADALAAATPSRDAAVIDVGCGTGLVGAELQRHGFRVIDGLDVSTDMLRQAEAKRVYRRLIAADLMAGAPVPDASYDMAICVGSFAPGHLGPAALAAIARLVRKDGPIVIFMNAVPYRDEHYEAQIRQLVDAGIWTEPAIESMNYMSALDRPGMLIRARRGEQRDNQWCLFKD